jgi:hypothetical protein
MLSIQNYLDSQLTDSGKVASLKLLPSFTPKNITFVSGNLFR